MRGKTGNVRRATQDLDLDFIRYSLSDASIDAFISKLKSLLKFGTLSSRYKDIFDIYYLSQHINKDTMRKCFKTYIFDDPNMREKDLNGVLRRLSLIFKDKLYVSHLNATDINWLEEDIDVVISGIISFIKKA